MLAPVRTTPPAVPVVTFEEASLWLRGDGVTEEKALVEGLIAAATARLDGWSGILGRCMVNQSWRQDFGGWCRDMRLPFPDVSAATIAYSDADGVDQDVDDANFTVLHDALGSFVRLSSAFTRPAVSSDRADAVRVTMVAGYGAAASDVPAPLRTAILLMVAHWFQNREAVADGALAELPMGVPALIAPYRRVGV